METCRQVEQVQKVNPRLAMGFVGTHGDFDGWSVLAMQAVPGDNKKNEKAPDTGAPIRCHHCGNSVPPGSRFCNMCGISLHRTRQEPAPGLRQREMGRKGESPGASKSTAAPAVRTSVCRSSPAQSGARAACMLQLLRGQPNIPAFSHHIMKVMRIMGSDEASTRHLTNTIVRDYSLTLAVLRTANSAYYNRSGKPICSVARAVTLIGIDAIKGLAGSLMLLEHYEKHSSGVKELLLLSLLTANHSRQVAQRLHFSQSDEAYLCGMFRNLGEIIIACYQPGTYEKILRGISENNLTERESCLKVLTFSFEEFGQTVAAHWNLPESVGQAMEACDPIAYNKQSVAEKLGTIVAFSHELTHYVYRHSNEDKVQAVNHLLGKYSAIADLSPEVIQDVLDNAVSETKETFAAVCIPFDDLRLRRQCQLASTGGKERKTAGAGHPDTFVQSELCLTLPAMIEESVSEEGLLDRLVAEVEAAIEPENEPRLNDVLMMALEACHRGARFDRVVFCLATPDRAMVRGRLGLGLGIEDVIEQIQIPLTGDRESLSLALLAKHDLFIDAQHDDSYQGSPLVRALAASSFGLYPIVVDQVVVGCLYFDSVQPHSLPAQSTLKTLARLRDMLTELIRRTRAHC